MESALTMKGQATIPKAVRDFLGVKGGDKIKFFFNPDGSVVILPKLPITALKGIVPLRRDKPATLDEMDRAIAAGPAQRAKRSGRR